MEIKSDISDVGSVVKQWKDLIRKEWVISKESLEGKSGAPLNPQEWIEHYYRVEGAIDFYEEATNKMD